jgi:ComF family protein
LRGITSRAVALARYVGPVVEGALQLVYPIVCAECGAACPEMRLPACALCLGRLDRVEPADLIDHLKVNPEIGRLDRTFALWSFVKGGLVQHLQHALKYGNRPGYGLHLGYMVGQAFVAAGSWIPDAVVPVPLHRTRRLERGYNQSALLANGFCSRAGIASAEHLLVRTHATRTQAHLSHEDRRQNVASAFGVPHPASVAGRRLLLIDDVLTTGATAVAAAAALRGAGAAGVGVAALALARS